jgi:undecaprenyl-diphosphatase
MYLGVHYFSDVVAGMAEGVAWLSLCLAGMQTYWQHRVAIRGSEKHWDNETEMKDDC